MALKFFLNVHKIVSNIHSPDNVYVVQTILWAMLLKSICSKCSMAKTHVKIAAIVTPACYFSITKNNVVNITY